MIKPCLLLLALIPGGGGDIPLINRPANFSGAAGVYRIEAVATPATVRVEDPITLTVKVVSLQPGPWRHPPQRDKLQLLPAELSRDFFIEPLPEDDRVVDAEKTWEFYWRLAPKRSGVLHIPALEFVYYHTAGSPDFKAAASNSITLDVKPRPTITLTAPAGTRAKFQHIVEGDNLLVKSPSARTLTLTLIGSLALPPLCCVAGYLLWRRLFPDAARRLRLHQGRALRMAFHRLHKLGLSPTALQFRQVVEDYLRLHVELPAGGPTAVEVKQKLLERGLPAEVASQAEAFFQNCDAAMFAPSKTLAISNFKADAEMLLQHLERDLCALSSR
jgi:hypothetical protein